jgi:DNA-binding GntR family transcriptional regulator
MSRKRSASSAASGVGRRPRTAQDKKTTAEVRIHRAICDAILERRLLPGTRLQEIALGEFFGVSRTIAHKALLVLAHEGIVSLRPKRVAVVARPSVEETRFVFEARRAIEAAVVPLVVRSATKARLGELRAMVHAENEAYARGDRAAGTRLSVGFHQRLAELGGNPVLARYVNELVLRTSLIVALYESPVRTAHPHFDHVEIVDRIAAGDEREATRAMVEHLAQLEGNLELKESEEAPTLADIFGSRILAPDRAPATPHA